VTKIDAVNTTACIAHHKYEDDETLSSQFSEKLSKASTGTPSTETPSTAVNETLTKLFPMVSRLHADVFPAAVPVAFLAIFLFSTIIFWVLVSSPGRTKAYKTILAGTTLLNGYGLTLGFMAAYATRQACRGLVLPFQGEEGVLDPDIYVTEGKTLQNLQWAVVGLSCVVQLSVCGLFVRRRMMGEGVVVSVLPPAARFRGRRRR
jgi:hypothetical protein